MVISNLEQIYQYQMKFQTPYFFSVDYESWKTSFICDVDGEGRNLFKELYVRAVYDKDKLIGFIQYGKTAFGFGDHGEISSEISYNVIRNLYFEKGNKEAGQLLLNEAMKDFEASKKVYAFFHYFGMSCFARHGKLFENHDFIDKLLKENGFEIEHENVYYSSVCKEIAKTEVEIIAHNLTKGNQQYMDFVLVGNSVGGCEVHFLEKKDTAYLRWIYVNENLTGRGIGSKCMDSLKSWLCQKGIKRLDTDTAMLNSAAQGYYKKNGFIREGITRSYIK